MPLYVGFFDFLICHGIFLFVKYDFPVTSSNSVKKLSQYSFGIYLTHVFVIEKLRDWAHFNTLSFSPQAGSQIPKNRRKTKCFVRKLFENPGVPTTV